MSTRHRHIVVGRVQGVGFRPFVYRLALDHRLTGTVRNAPEGVVIEVQGDAQALEAFRRDLGERLPPLALIVRHEVRPVATVPGEDAFVIETSRAGHGHNVLVSPDIATCPDCLADMADPGNRRFEYPFTNCTNCGPRYTITRSVPYDRETTSMACFPMCPDCAAEYGDPLDRRFHAQPNACPVCGPAVWLVDPAGTTLARGRQALDRAGRELASGRILALKGLGGFHLAVDATNHQAVARLRRRKRRPAKPLAIMTPNLETLARLAEIGPAQRRVLTGRERPIVLTRLLSLSPLSPLVSPDTEELGAMLPYTPLHHVLLARYAAQLPPGRPAALVMTSGNASSEPIALGNREALERLGDIADVFLLHDRDILVRTDDSVVRVLPGGPDPTETDRMQFLRRARGYTPQPLFLARGGPCVLGVGPEQKCTVCLTKDDQAFVSQHIGDMHNLETASFHAEIIDHLQSILQVSPEALVADLHPDYLATRYALGRDDVPVYRLQHHFAHVLAVLAENRVYAPALGLALDGSGLGEDGTVWGGEFLFVDPRDLTMRRLGHLSPVRLPGGEAAIRHPWRMALAYCHALGTKAPIPTARPWLPELEKESALVSAMLDKAVNSPVTTSCGRLFDAVSAMLGLVRGVSYEGQAAILLERVQDHAETVVYDCPAVFGPGPAHLDTLTLFAQAARDAARGVPAPQVSRRFHLGLAKGLANMAQTLADGLGLRIVALSGGVFLNRTISLLLPRLLADRGLEAAVHSQLPPGDGCISLGQAFFGQQALKLGWGVSLADR